MFDVGLKGQVRVHSDMEVSDWKKVMLVIVDDRVWGAN